MDPMQLTVEKKSGISKLPFTVIKVRNNETMGSYVKNRKH